MGGTKVIPGNLLDAYTDAEAEQLGLKGEVAQYGGKLYKFCQNLDASNALAENQCAKITDYDAFGVKPNGTLGKVPFGGMRPDGADSLAAYTTTSACWGWLQILGYTETALEGDTCTAIVADSWIVLDDDSDLGRVGGVINTTDLTGNDAADKTAVEAALNSLAGAFAIAVANSAGVADTATLMNIVRNGWGQYAPTL